MKEIYFENKSVTFNKDTKGNPIYSNKMILSNVIIVPVMWIELIKKIFISGIYDNYIQSSLFINTPNEFKKFIAEIHGQSCCIVWKERSILRFVNTKSYIEDVGVNINEMKISNNKLTPYTYLQIYTPYKITN